MPAPNRTLSRACLFWAALALAPALRAAAPFGAADALFMGPVWDPQRYEPYQARWVLWGPESADRPFQLARAAGVKIATSFWCLTAGPVQLHHDPALAEAVCRDIEGQPILVPWQADATYLGTPTWFGCTNAPAFQALLEQRADAAAAARPDGLHIDDPAGTLATVDWSGGCYCRHCMAGFRGWLQAHDSPALRAAAGVGAWTGFDYAALVRETAPTRAATIQRAAQLPLRQAFVRYQLEARLQGLGALRDRVRAATRPDLPFSLNAYYSEPGSHFTALAGLVTHLVAEVEHHAEAGTARLWEAAQAYRQAEALGRPLAATAAGSDYAYVKAHGAIELPKTWVALGYAMGQRLMVPHPERQWCHTPALGTHWYANPVEPYAPLYAFAREHAGLLEGFSAIGPTAVRRVRPEALLGSEARAALARELKACSGPAKAGEHVWLLPRRHPDGRLALHLLNTQYSSDAGLLAPVVDLAVALPQAWLPAGTRRLRVLRPGEADLSLPLRFSGEQASFVLPAMDVWAIAEARPGL